MFARFFLPAIALGVLLASCDKNDSAPLGSTSTSPCHDGSRRDSPCRLSVYQLIGSLPSVSGKYVEVVLFYEGDGSRVLFVNEDAALNLDRSSAFFVDDHAPNLQAHRGYVRLWAKFDMDRQDHGNGFETYRQLGVFSDVQRVRGVRRVPGKGQLLED